MEEETAEEEAITWSEGSVYRDKILWANKIILIMKLLKIAILLFFNKE